MTRSPGSTKLPASGQPPISRSVVTVMAVSTGAVVANLYYAQPIEAGLARALHASTGAVGVVLTVTQVGYALGLAALVPLGDLLERRRLLTVLLSVAVLGMAGMAAAPSVAALAAAAAVVGVTSVAVQIIVPIAAQVSAGARQGRVVSTVMSGLLLGILLSRTVSGLIAQAAGWRTVFAAGAVVTALSALALRRWLPALAPHVTLPYPRLLASVVSLVREEPVLRIRMAFGAMVFASFSVLWASVGFLLAGPPYHWNNLAIGLFALVGALGAVAAQSAGRLADRGRAQLATGGFLLVMVVSYLLLSVGRTQFVALAAGAALLDLGCQGTHISNQSLVFRLRPEARSRVNTAYMVAYFTAGAAGTAASAALYTAWGWHAVCILGAALPAAALLLWLAAVARQRRLRRHR